MYITVVIEIIITDLGWQVASIYVLVCKIDRHLGQLWGAAYSIRGYEFFVTHVGEHVHSLCISMESKLELDVVLSNLK